MVDVKKMNSEIATQSEFRRKNLRRKIKSLVATHDMYTLKWVEEYNHEQRSGISFHRKCYQEINKLLEARGFKKTIYFNALPSVYEGIHSLIIERKQSSLDGYVINDWGRACILCKIPKGSHYYIGAEGDIVSSSLIMIEPIVTSCNSLEETISAKTTTSATKIAREIVKSYGYFTLKPKID